MKPTELFDRRYFMKLAGAAPLLAYVTAQGLAEKAWGAVGKSAPPSKPPRGISSIFLSYSTLPASASPSFRAPKPAWSHPALPAPWRPPPLPALQETILRKSG